MAWSAAPSDTFMWSLICIKVVTDSLEKSVSWTGKIIFSVNLFHTVFHYHVGHIRLPFCVERLTIFVIRADSRFR